jgi:hypothetical protein
MKGKLIPFVGLDKEGKMRIHLSAFEVHTPTPMHERGIPMPDIAHKELEDHECLTALQILTNYYNTDDKKERRTKK